jgi:antitoxin component YwqK of YwqJK toxin-antitoxin module
MNLIRFILLLLALYVEMDATAQSGSIPQKERSSINQTDSKGNRTGTWWIRAAERMGEPAYSEVGNYDHGHKIGTWYKIDGEGDMVSIENFKNNVLDGEVKYYDRGHLTCIGHYRGLNPSQAYDTIIVTNPATGAEFLKQISTDKGTLRHGMWRYYDAMTGRLIREEEYQVDDLIYKKDFAAIKQDSSYYKKREQFLLHPPGR